MAPARSSLATSFDGVTGLIVLTGMDFGLGGSSAFAAAGSDHLQHALREEGLNLGRPASLREWDEPLERAV